MSCYSLRIARLSGMPCLLFVEYLRGRELYLHASMWCHTLRPRLDERLGRGVGERTVDRVASDDLAVLAYLVEVLGGHGPRGVVAFRESASYDGAYYMDERQILGGERVNAHL